MNKTVAGIVLVAGLGMSSSAMAWDTVIVNGKGFSCENHCVINTHTGEVTDSQGGLVSGPFEVINPPLEP